MSANSGDPDQMPRYAASDLGLHRLPMSHKKGAWRKWIKKLPFCLLGYFACFFDIG